MTKPLVVINFKNYVSGKAALDLARNIEIYYNNAMIAPPFLDIKEIAQNVNMPVFSQHADFREPGKSTGFIIPESILSVGAQGAILNHSEHKLSFPVLKKTIDRCRANGLKTIICASTLKEVGKIMKFKPYAIAFEDPKLIGTGRSVTREDSTIVASFSKMLEKTSIIPLCGAGISSASDVAKAIILGCRGVLVASAVAKPAIPGSEEKFLKELAGLF
jgi:triosephosphate isomerase (TIM)